MFKAQILSKEGEGQLYRLEQEKVRDPASLSKGYGGLFMTIQTFTFSNCHVVIQGQEHFIVRSNKIYSLESLSFSLAPRNSGRQNAWFC